MADYISTDKQHSPKHNLFEYLRDYQAARDSILAKGKTPILCGGTGLYVEAVLNGLKLPEVPENKALRAELAGKSLEELTAILERIKKLHNTTDIDTAKRAIRAIEIQQYYHEHPWRHHNCCMPLPDILRAYCIIQPPLLR